MRALLILIFAASGFAGLVYESVWSHYLRILVGAAAYAQSLVLAVFMGGMALGAWLASRERPQWGDLLRAYAVVEGLLGVLALLFHPIFVTVEGALSDGLLAGAPLGIPAGVLRWSAAVLLILPQSVLLGMTFPFVAAGFLRRFPDRPGASLAILYFANALGGAVGVLAGGFALIRWVGLPGTVLTAGVLNLLLAGAVWWGFAPERDGAPDVTSSAETPLPTGMSERALLLVACGAGLASFVYEVVWIRMLSLVLSSSAHAFELMLSAFILGIALGGLWIRGRADTLARPVRFLGSVQLAMGALAVATLPLYARLFPLMQGLMEALPATPSGYLRFNLASHGMALVVMLPATLCAGATLPLLTHVLLQAGFGERSIGRAYGVNTLGAMAGALLTVHFAMPALGLKGALGVGAGVNLVLGAYLLRGAVEASPRRAVFGWASFAGVLAAGALALTSLDPAVLSSGVYRRYVDLGEARRATVLDYTDGKTASVSLVREERGVINIRTNGKPSSSMADADTLDATGDETVSTLLGALPLLLHPDARDAVNVGMGSGITSQVLLSSPALESLTTVEIEPAMVRLAAGFGPRNERVFTDVRSSVVVQDARAFLTTTPETFDIVVTQPFNPWISGAGSLYSTEFYAVVRSRLRPGGLLVQWIQLNETEISSVASILRAIADHFPRMHLYAGVTGDVIVVASPDRPIPELDGSVFHRHSLRSDLERVEIRTIQDLGMRTAGDERTVAALLDLVPSPANSEFRPYVEERAARARFTEAAAEEVLNLMVQPLPIMELLDILAPPWTKSEATPTMAFFYSARPVGAVAFRDLVLLGQDPSREGSPFERRARDEALSLQHDCAYQGFGEDALPAFYGVATTIVTDLRPAELDAVWQGLEAWSCVRDLVGDQRRWLDFFRAVGHRDAASIAVLAPELLGLPDVLTPARSRYLVASGMVANIAIGHAEAAFELWLRYRDGLFEDGEPTFLFRHLEALARRDSGM